MAALRVRWIGCASVGIAVGLLAVSLPTPSRADAEAEAFEVLVLRGSTIARVSGDGSGPLSEVTVREDPHPPPAPPSPQLRSVEESSPKPEVVIHIDRSEPDRYAVPAWRYPLHRPLLAPDRTRLHDWGARHQHGNYRLGARPPRGVLRSSRR